MRFSEFLQGLSQLPVLSTLDFFKRSGRINRARYLGLTSFYFSFLFIATYKGLLPYTNTSILLLLQIAVYATVVPNIIFLKIRRLRDLDLNSDYLFATNVPIFGVLYRIGIFFRKGTDGVNKFGEPDISTTLIDYLLMLTTPVMFLMFLWLSYLNG